MIPRTRRREVTARRRAARASGALALLLACASVETPPAEDEPSRANAPAPTREPAIQEPAIQEPAIQEPAIQEPARRETPRPPSREPPRASSAAFEPPRVDAVAKERCAEQHKPALTADVLQSAELAAAAECFEHAGDVASAIRIRRVLLSSFAHARELDDTLAGLGRGFEAVGRLDAAATHYERFAAQYALDPRAPALLERAVCLRADLDDHVNAEADLEQLKRRHRESRALAELCPPPRERYPRLAAASLREALLRGQCETSDAACRCDAVCRARLPRPPDGSTRLRFHDEQGAERLAIVVDPEGHVEECRHGASATAEAVTRPCPDAAP
ncbi:MAG: hypothetical protein H6713_06690 [Myxococcales bacterium]|nr:hypothetical protein [Myxococcales bacterium]